MHIGADAQRIAQRGTGAVGGDQQAGAQRTWTGSGFKPGLDMLIVLLQRRDACRAQALQIGQFRQARFQRGTQLARHDHGAERIQPACRSIQLHAAEITATGDMDMPDRCRRRRDMAPYTQRLQRIDAGTRQRQIAFIETRGRRRQGRRRFGQRHTQSGTFQRTGQAAPDQPATDDQHIAEIFHRAMIRQRAAMEVEQDQGLMRSGTRTSRSGHRPAPTQSRIPIPGFYAPGPSASGMVRRSPALTMSPLSALAERRLLSVTPWRCAIRPRVSPRLTT